MQASDTDRHSDARRQITRVHVCVLVRTGITGRDGVYLSFIYTYIGTYRHHRQRRRAAPYPNTQAPSSGRWARPWWWQRWPRMHACMHACVRACVYSCMRVCTQVGKAVAVAALDMMPSSDGSSATANPWSRLPNCQQHRSIAEAHAWLKSRLLTTDPYRAQVFGHVACGVGVCVSVCACSPASSPPNPTAPRFLNPNP